MQVVSYRRVTRCLPSLPYLHTPPNCSQLGPFTPHDMNTAAHSEGQAICDGNMVPPYSTCGVHILGHVCRTCWDWDSLAISDSRPICHLPRALPLTNSRPSTPATASRSGHADIVHGA